MGSGASIAWYFASYASTRVASTSNSSPSTLPGAAPMSMAIRFTAASWSASVRIGWICIPALVIFHLPDVNLVVLFVRTHPNDEEHLVVVVDRNDQPVVVPLDVEDDTFGRNDACRAVLCFQLCRTLSG